MNSHTRTRTRTSERTRAHAHAHAHAHTELYELHATLSLYYILLLLRDAKQSLALSVVIVDSRYIWDRLPAALTDDGAREGRRRGGRGGWGLGEREGREGERFSLHNGDRLPAAA